METPCHPTGLAALRTDSWRRRPRFALCGLIAFGLAGVACEAQFIDLRDDPGVVSDSDEEDRVAAEDPTVQDGDTSGDPEPQAQEIVREGTWTGRTDYRASGSVQLVRRPDGQLIVQMGEDFSVSRVPGPVVVLSYREALGTRIDEAAGDVELGRLEANSGAQSYVAPAGVDDRLFAWVYCKPFGLEVGRAPLEER